MKRASYRDAIVWIAEKDSQGCEGRPLSMDLGLIGGTLCAEFCSMLYGVSLEEVAAEVLLVRTKARAEQLRKQREAGKP